MLLAAQIVLGVVGYFIVGVPVTIITIKTAREEEPSWIGMMWLAWPLLILVGAMYGIGVVLGWVFKRLGTLMGTLIARLSALLP